MGSLRGRDQDLLRALAVANRDLPDRAAYGTGSLVCLQQQLDLRRRADGVGWNLDALRLTRRTDQLAEGKASATPAPHLGGEVGGLQQSVLGEVLGVDVTHPALMDDAQAGSEVVPGADALHLAFLDADRLISLSLDEEFDEIGARLERALDHAVHEG